jgi:hypothetical protein
VDYITSSLSTVSIPGDAVLVYPQFSSAENISAFIGYRAVSGEFDETYVLTDYPSLFGGIV